MPLRPATTLEAYWRSKRFDLDDYRFTAAASPAVLQDPLDVALGEHGDGQEGVAAEVAREQ